MSKEDAKKVQRALEYLAEEYGIESWKDAILDFAISELNDKQADANVRKAIASLLITMHQYGKLGIRWNNFQKPLQLTKAKGELNPFDYRDEYAEAYSVVMDYMACFIDENTAIERIIRIAPIRRRSAQAFISKHRREIAKELQDASHLNNRPIIHRRNP